MKTKKTLSFLHHGPAWVRVETRQSHQGYETVRARNYNRLTEASYRRLLRLADTSRGVYKVKKAGILGCYITRISEAHSIIRESAA